MLTRILFTATILDTTVVRLSPLFPLSTLNVEVKHQPYYQRWRGKERGLSVLKLEHELPTVNAIYAWYCI